MSSRVTQALEPYRQKFSSLLPHQIGKGEERMWTALLKAANDPKLSRCSPDSIIQAALKSAELGIPCDGQYGALVPYGGECQFQAMYKGLVDCARRTGEIKLVWSHLVYEGDEFSIGLGTNPMLTHVPDYNAKRDETTCIGTYACAEWANGRVQFEYMTRDEILAVKSKVKAKNGPWFTGGWAHEGQMWKKTPLRRLCNMLPMSNELVAYFGYEDKIEHEEPVEVEHEVVTQEADPTKSVAALARRETKKPDPERIAPLMGGEGPDVDLFVATPEPEPDLPDFIFDVVPIPPDLTWDLVAMTTIPSKDAHSALFEQTFAAVRRDPGLLVLIEPAVEHAIKHAKGCKPVPEGALFAAVTKYMILKDDEKDES